MDMFMESLSRICTHPKTKKEPRSGRGEEWFGEGSGYGRRLKCKRSWVRIHIPDTWRIILHIYLQKLINSIGVWRYRKWTKKRPGWPILKRKVVQHSKKWSSAKSVKENFAKSIRPWEEKSLTLLQIVKLPHSPLSKKWNDNRIGQKKNKLLRELRKLNCDLYIFPALAWCQDGVFTTNTLFTFTNDNSDSV